MPTKSSQIYEFGGFRLNTAEKLLLHGETPIPLTPKVFDTLLVLVENAGRLLEKEELMTAIWRDRYVEEGNLAFNIKVLRKALGDPAAAPQFIETVPRRGYRFIAEVRPTTSAAVTDAAVSETLPVGRRSSVPALIFIVLLVSVFGIAFVWVGGKNYFRAREPKPARLTSSGRIANFAVSADGRLLVFSQKEAAGESLQLRRLETGEQTELIAARDVEYIGLALTPAADFVYFSIFSKNAAGQSLSRIPVSGGAPVPIDGTDADVAVSFSPDGRRFAFTESHSSLRQTELKIADADGSNQKLLIRATDDVRRIPAYRASPAAWSPDGRAIACVVNEIEDAGLVSRIILVDPVDGRERYLSDAKWRWIQNLVWLDADRLAFIEFEPDSPVTRILQLSVKTGETRPLTDEPGRCEWLGSANGQLFTLRQTVFSSLHVADFFQIDKALQSKQIFGENGPINNVAWSRDGRLLYNSWASGRNEIWEINADGTAPRRLTTNSNLVLSFAVSPADESLVFSALENGGMALAAADRDGRNIRRLTDGPEDISPAFLPDGKTVVFQRGSSVSTLWTAKLDNPQRAAQITGYAAVHPSVSPDGKRIAFHFMDYGERTPFWKLGLIDSVSHRLLDKLAFPVPISQRETVWHPKENLIALAYQNGENAGLLFWSMDDGRYRTLDDAGAGRIAALGWSPDGKRFAFVRTFENSDVAVLGD
ncbi:MAG: PD40 domain-containing protein [Acidobacteria bacterium]|nr:PD40 domain-containing protein [Acidobacteriota bacterium]